MDAKQAHRLVCDLAGQFGFPAVGIARAGPFARAGDFDQWLQAGRHGEMHYLARTRALRLDPRRLLPGAQSVIVVADAYTPADDAADEVPDNAPRGRIARYAWGRDYHRVLRRKLKRLADRLHEVIAEPFATRVCVDTAPIVEREVAAAAGLGWIGKNTLVLHPRLGSYFFLGEIVTTLEVAPSEPVTDHCGSCTRCLEACPTGALDGPYRMDATRCISYLTIEHRSQIASDLQRQMGDWIFGCDVCQEVCPYNRKALPAGEPAYAADGAGALAARPRLETIAQWTEQDRQEQLAGTAMKRAKLSMWKRNAAIALENLKRTNTTTA